MTETHRRTLEISEELVRAYSRRGNYHSEASTSAALGLPGLVAQGVQAAGPAYGILLDEWGEAFLATGEIDVRFVGLVLAGDTIDTAVTFDGDTATIDVVNRRTNTSVVVGNARRASSG